MEDSTRAGMDGIEAQQPSPAGALRLALAQPSCLPQLQQQGLSGRQGTGNCAFPLGLSENVGASVRERHAAWLPSANNGDRLVWGGEHWQTPPPPDVVMEDTAGAGGDVSRRPVQPEALRQPAGRAAAPISPSQLEGFGSMAGAAAGAPLGAITGPGDAPLGSPTPSAEGTSGRSEAGKGEPWGALGRSGSGADTDVEAGAALEAGSSRHAANTAASEGFEEMEAPVRRGRHKGLICCVRGCNKYARLTEDNVRKYCIQHMRQMGLHPKAYYNQQQKTQPAPRGTSASASAGAGGSGSAPGGPIWSVDGSLGAEAEARLCAQRLQAVHGLQAAAEGVPYAALLGGGGAGNWLVELVAANIQGLGQILGSATGPARLPSMGPALMGPALTDVQRASRSADDAASRPGQDRPLPLSHEAAISPAFSRDAGRSAVPGVLDIAAGTRDPRAPFATTSWPLHRAASAPPQALLLGGGSDDGPAKGGRGDGGRGGSDRGPGLGSVRGCGGGGGVDARGGAGDPCADDEVIASELDAARMLSCLRDLSGPSPRAAALRRTGSGAVAAAPEREHDDPDGFEQAHGHGSMKPVSRHASAAAASNVSDMGAAGSAMDCDDEGAPSGSAAGGRRGGAVNALTRATVEEAKGLHRQAPGFAQETHGSQLPSPAAVNQRHPDLKRLRTSLEPPLPLPLPVDPRAIAMHGSMGSGDAALGPRGTAAAEEPSPMDRRWHHSATVVGGGQLQEVFDPLPSCSGRQRPSSTGDLRVGPGSALGPGHIEDAGSGSGAAHGGNARRAQDGNMDGPGAEAARNAANEPLVLRIVDVDMALLPDVVRLLRSAGSLGGSLPAILLQPAPAPATAPGACPLLPPPPPPGLVRTLYQLPDGRLVRGRELDWAEAAAGVRGSRLEERAARAAPWEAAAAAELAPGEASDWEAEGLLGGCPGGWPAAAREHPGVARGFIAASHTGVTHGFTAPISSSTAAARPSSERAPAGAAATCAPGGGAVATWGGAGLPPCGSAPPPVLLHPLHPPPALQERRSMPLRLPSGLVLTPLGLSSPRPLPPLLQEEQQLPQPQQRYWQPEQPRYGSHPCGLVLTPLSPPFGLPPPPLPSPRQLPLRQPHQPPPLPMQPQHGAAFCGSAAYTADDSGDEQSRSSSCDWSASSADVGAA